MRIFGITFETKRELKEKVARLEALLDEREGELEELDDAISSLMDIYPFDIGEKVYDIQLRGVNGRYTRTRASLAHSLINEVVVDEKNYFKLRKRLRAHDVFRTREAAQGYLQKVCK